MLRFLGDLTRDKVTNLVRAATSRSSPKPDPALFAKVADVLGAADENIAVVLHVVHQRLRDMESDVRVYKALCLVEHLVQHGPHAQRFLSEARTHLLKDVRAAHEAHRLARDGVALKVRDHAHLLVMALDDGTPAVPKRRLLRRNKSVQPTEHWNNARNTSTGSSGGSGHSSRRGKGGRGMSLVSDDARTSSQRHRRDASLTNFFAELSADVTDNPSAPRMPSATHLEDSTVGRVFSGHASAQPPKRSNSDPFAELMSGMSVDERTPTLEPAPSPSTPPPTMGAVPSSPGIVLRNAAGEQQLVDLGHVGRALLTSASLASLVSNDSSGGGGAHQRVDSLSVSRTSADDSGSSPQRMRRSESRTSVFSTGSDGVEVDRKEAMRRIAVTTLQDVIKDDTLRALMIQFCGHPSQRSTHLLQFWLATRDFATVKDADERRARAQEVYNAYISRKKRDSAVQDLPLSVECKKTTLQRLRQRPLPPDAFDAARKEVEDVIALQILPKFKRTKAFVRVVSHRLAREEAEREEAKRAAVSASFWEDSDDDAAEEKTQKSNGGGGGGRDDDDDDDGSSSEGKGGDGGWGVWGRIDEEGAGEEVDPVETLFNGLGVPLQYLPTFQRKQLTTEDIPYLPQAELSALIPSDKDRQVLERWVQNYRRCDAQRVVVSSTGRHRPQQRQQAPRSNTGADGSRRGKSKARAPLKRTFSRRNMQEEKEYEELHRKLLESITGLHNDAKTLTARRRTSLADLQQQRQQDQPPRPPPRLAQKQPPPPQTPPKPRASMSTKAQKLLGVHIVSAEQLKRDAAEEQGDAGGDGGARERRSSSVAESLPSPPSADSSSAKAAVNREKALAEIVESEKAYVDNLTKLVDVFVAPLKDPYFRKVVKVKPDQVHILFANIEMIHSLHRVFLMDLKMNPDVGKVFIDNAQFFARLYSQYTTQYDKCLGMMNKLSDNRDFEAWLEQKRAELGLDIMSFLIMPIQRIPRYELLIREVLRYTPEDHPERDVLSRAFTQVQKVARTINERKRQAESYSKLLELQNTLKNIPPDFKLIAQGRTLVRHERVEYKSKSLLTSFKECICFLFSDVLVWCTVGMSFKGFIYLKDAIVDDFDALSAVPERTINIRDPDHGKKLTIITATEDSKLTWIAEFSTWISAAYTKTTADTIADDGGGNDDMFVSIFR